GSDSQVRAAGCRGVVAGPRGRRPGLEVGRVRERLADQLGAECVPVRALDQAAVRAEREEELCHGGHRQWVDEPGHDQRHDRDSKRDDCLTQHDYTIPIVWSTRSIALMPTNGAITPPTPYNRSERRSSAAAPIGR